MYRQETLWDLHGLNTTGDDNYVILDAEGKGQYVGCLLNIDNFDAAWGFPSCEYSALYHGISLDSDPQEHFGKWSLYRFHIEDPVRFTKSIKVTIEHGHANDQGNDYSSVAYRYKLEPHKALQELPDVNSRLQKIWPEHGLRDY